MCGGYEMFPHFSLQKITFLWQRGSEHYFWSVDVWSEFWTGRRSSWPCLGWRRPRFSHCPASDSGASAPRPPGQASSRSGILQVQSVALPVTWLLCSHRLHCSLAFTASSDKSSHSSSRFFTDFSLGTSILRSSLSLAMAKDILVSYLTSASSIWPPTQFKNWNKIAIVIKNKQHHQLTVQISKWRRLHWIVSVIRLAWLARKMFEQVKFDW